MTDDDSPWMRRPVSTAASTRLSFSPRLHFTPQSKAQAVSPNAMHPRRQNNPTITKKRRRACISPLITLRGAGAAGRKPSDPDPKAKKKSGNGRRRVKTRSQSWAFQQSSAQGNAAHLVLPTSSYRLSKGHSFRSASFPKQAATVVGEHRRGKYEELSVRCLLRICYPFATCCPYPSERRERSCPQSLYGACHMGGMHKHPGLH